MFESCTVACDRSSTGRARPTQSQVRLHPPRPRLAPVVLGRGAFPMSLDKGLEDVVEQLLKFCSPPVWDAGRARAVEPGSVLSCLRILAKPPLPGSLLKESRSNVKSRCNTFESGLLSSRYPARTPHQKCRLSPSPPTAWSQSVPTIACFHPAGPNKRQTHGGSLASKSLFLKELRHSARPQLLLWRRAWAVTIPLPRLQARRRHPMGRKRRRASHAARQRIDATLLIP